MKTKIPDHAILKFEGMFVRIYQWEQEMFDGTKQIFEQTVRKDGVMIFAVADGKMMIEEELQPLWTEPLLSIPAGTCEEFEEDVLMRAKEELREETGYESDDWELWNTWSPHGTITWNNYIYIARNCKRVGEPKFDPGEKITVDFMEFDDFVDHGLQPNFRHEVLKPYFLLMKHDEEFRNEIKKRLFK